MGNQHIHHNEIKAWADGKTIEFFGKLNQKWIATKNPSWSLTSMYRVKPSHPHQALMDEYAAGCIQLEIYNKYTDSWDYIDNPCWDIDLKYRIRDYVEGEFYFADYEGYQGIALRSGNSWKFMAPDYTGSYYVNSLTVHHKVME